MTYDTAVSIGSGGMGEVFKAWDPELGRWVALKYLRHSDPELVERLLREARAQARIDHPGICQVYAVGSDDDDRPFIAMQYVEGRHLSDAAEDMTLEEKVLIVKRVAEAVQAAHAVGLIHRDLKPSNILVADGEGGEPRPYVLDFGIAREQEIVGLTVSGQVLGTPGYLSPEQARGETLLLDRRTDIFSLGIVLYELCSGSRPFDGDSNVELLVSLLERDPVPLRDRLPSLPQDLETIVMTCLEKEPERRYASARALADDLQRFLDGDPVSARPVSRGERLLRRARKHPVTAAAIAIAGLAIVALVVVAVGGWVKYTVDLRAERNTALAARSRAEAREREAREISDFLVDVFSTADPEESYGETITAREILDRGAERVSHELAERPGVEARLLGVIGQAYIRLGLHDRARPLLERALEKTLGLPDRSAEAEIEARVRLADVCIHLADVDRAEELVAAIPQTVAANPDIEPEYVVQALGCVGRVQYVQGRAVEAQATLSRALEIAEKTLGRDDAVVSHILTTVAAVATDQQHWERAVAASRRALEIREQAYDPLDPRVTTTAASLALALRGAGQLDEAAEVGQRVLDNRRQTLGENHPRTSTALNNLGLIYRKMGRLDDAEEMYTRALDIRVSTLGEDHPRVATVLANLAWVHFERGELERSEQCARRAVAIVEAAYGPDHVRVAAGLFGLMRVARAREDFTEVERLGLRDLRIRQSAYGSDSPSLVGDLRLLGWARFNLGRLDAAADDLQRARRIAVAAWGADDERTIEVEELLARVETARQQVAAGGRAASGEARAGARE